MKTRLLAASSVAVLGFIASPGGAAVSIGGEVGDMPAAPGASTSTVSRAAVQDEARQAVQTFNRPATAEGRDVGAGAATGPSLTRDQVRAEARSAVKESRFFGGRF